MSRVLLRRLHIANLGPIQDDTLELQPFTYLVGRNNAGKSHYIKAIEFLLATKAPSREDIFKAQNDKKKPIVIEGFFEGVQAFTHNLIDSSHQKVINNAIVDGVLRVVRELDSAETKASSGQLCIRNKEGSVIPNPTGFLGNLLKVLPEPISIGATDNTSDELKNKSGTAFVKLKQEVLGPFFEHLGKRAETSFTSVAEFLNSSDKGKRSLELIEFENELAKEFVGEFANVKPSVEFELPDEEIIAEGMKIFLDDGYRSEVEQKGHGLQRATLIALLRLLARRGQRYQERPAPIFLIGELETFLHPYAQRQLAEALGALITQYQVLTTTHSPFIIEPDFVEGYRRVVRSIRGTNNIMPKLDALDADEVRRHLRWRGNLEGMFADRVVLVEGVHDEGFFERVRQVLSLSYEVGKFTLFVGTSGRKQLRVVRRFYQQMGLDDVAIIGDLDYVFSGDIKFLLKELDLDPLIIDSLRKDIGWDGDKDPSLKDVITAIQSNGEPKQLSGLLNNLRAHRVFILRRGAPEYYLKHGTGSKNDWIYVNSEADLDDVQYLRELVSEVLEPGKQKRSK